MTTTATQQNNDDEKAAELISFAAFLENTPPSQVRVISDLVYKQSPQHSRRMKEPQLLLHCGSEICNGPRAFRCSSDAPTVHDSQPFSRDFYLTYVCSNCRLKFKTFSLHASLTADSENTGTVFKFGERPPFGPTTPNRLLKLLGDQKEIFLKGRRCEFQGLGVGAFSYYRRVVESQKVRILDEIIKVAAKIGQNGVIVSLEAAKGEQQFTKSISMVKGAIPQTLLINGHNPLTLLHRALSDGLHDRSDEHCLQLAHDIRVVLAELSERLSQALKDEDELNTAVSRLLNVKE